MKKVILLLLMCIVFSNFVIADPSFAFKKGEDSWVRLPVHNNNYSQCVSCDCYLTVSYPNGSILVDNVAMTFSNGTASYLLDGSQTSISGEHTARVVCDNMADWGFSTFTYEVTDSGSLTYISFNFMLFAVLFIVGMVFLVFAHYTANRTFGFAGGSLFMICGIYSLVYGINDVTTMYTRAVAYVIMFIGLYALIVSAYSSLDEVMGNH